MHRAENEDKNNNNYSHHFLVCQPYRYTVWCVHFIAVKAIKSLTKRKQLNNTSALRMRAPGALESGKLTMRDNTNSICRTYNAVQCKNLFGIFNNAAAVVVFVAMVVVIDFFLLFLQAYRYAMFVCVTLLLFLLLLPISSYPSFCSLISRLFAIRCMGTGAVRTNGKTYSKIVLFILNVCTCVNFAFHNFMRHSFCYHFGQFLDSQFGLQFAEFLFI